MSQNLTHKSVTQRGHQVTRTERILGSRADKAAILPGSRLLRFFASSPSGRAVLRSRHLRLICSRRAANPIAPRQQRRHRQPQRRHHHRRRHHHHPQNQNRKCGSAQDRLQNANGFRDTAKVLRIARAGAAWFAVGRLLPTEKSM
jgi:hypothetical protein